MHRKYLIYVHEKDRYELYYFSGIVRSNANYYVIDFEDHGELLHFLKHSSDQLYPAHLIIDLYDLKHVHMLLEDLRYLWPVPPFPVAILWENKMEPFTHESVQWYIRPQNHDAWEKLARTIIQ